MGWNAVYVFPFFIFPRMCMGLVFLSQMSPSQAGLPIVPKAQLRSGLLIRLCQIPGNQTDHLPSSKNNPRRKNWSTTESNGKDPTDAASECTKCKIEVGRSSRNIDKCHPCHIENIVLDLVEPSCQGES
jgi:hypothetical protein